MRILLVTQRAPISSDPSGRQVTRLAGALAGLGHEVTLLAPGSALIPGIRCVPLPGALRPGARLELWLSVMTTMEVLRHRPDVAYVRLSPSTSFGPLALTLGRIPYAVELNQPIAALLREHDRPAPVVRAVHEVLRRVVSGARAVVVPSPRLRRVAEEDLGAKRIELIENGVELEVAQPGDRNEARARLGLPLEARILTFVGTLTPALRLDLLTAAHRLLAGVTLLVVGDGPQRPHLDQLVADGSPGGPVIALGARPHGEALDAIRAADVCVNVHDSDLALKSLEYAALGRRQVCLRVEGLERLERLYPSSLDALIVAEYADPPALASALARALEVEGARGPLPNDAVEAARRELSWTRKAERLSALLEEVH
ncbi:MAG: glycosyltransferase [Deltaproteobacteria bacterium]|nr:glycosyltransferase [Deltaproteobacteria bacterium]